MYFVWFVFDLNYWSYEIGKIGIIDLGSNTARLVIVEMLGDGHFIVIDQLKESVRLGKDMERDGFLKPQRIAETLKTLKMFRKLCDAYGIEKIIAVATAAVRRAKTSAVSSTKWLPPAESNFAFSRRTKKRLTFIKA